MNHYQCCDTNDWKVENIITNQTRKEYAQCDSESHTLKHTFLLDFPAWCTKIPLVIVWREETIGMSKPATVLGGSDGNLWSHARSMGYHQLHPNPNLDAHPMAQPNDGPIQYLPGFSWPSSCTPNLVVSPPSHPMMIRPIIETVHWTCSIGTANHWVC